MLIFGHKWVETEGFVKVFSKEEIKQSQPSEILLLEPLDVSLQLARYCREENLPYAVVVNSLKEAILANALEARYIVCQHEQAIEIQKIADDYLFDTRVLVLVEEDREIETMARFSIDGVIFPRAIRHL